MKRWFFCIICVLVVLFQACSVTYAHGRKEHDKHIEKVLFGRDNYHAVMPKDKREALKVLESAAFLCPDQYNSSGAEELETLKQFKVEHLPNSINDIDFTANYAHRKYTHLGWTPQISPEKGNWDKRKQILLATVNKVFDFGWKSDITIFGHSITDYSEQCDAMAALLYYIHILGDIQELETYERYRREGSYVFPLARANPGENNSDILYELTTKYLPKLFSSQLKQKEDYKELQGKLNSIASDARRLVGSIGGINNEEKYSQYRGYTLQVMEILSEYMPDLLLNETFFYKAFGGL